MRLRPTANLEEFHQVMELTMNISADGHGALDGLDVALLGQDLLCFLAQYFDLLNIIIKGIIASITFLPDFLRVACTP